VNARLDQNQAELRVLVLAVRLEVLAHGDGLLDEMPEVLGYGRCKAIRLEHTENFVPSDKAHLGDTMRVTESDTNLRGREAFARKLDDVFNDVIWRRLQPRWWGTAVRKGRGRNALSGSMHTTHGG